MNAHREPRRRVVVTGVGVVAPNGHDLDTFWSSICRGESAVGDLTCLNPADYPTKIAAEVRNWKIPDEFMSKRARRLNRSGQFCLVAAARALKDAGIRVADMDPTTIGLIEGSSLGNFDAISKCYQQFNDGGFTSVSSLALINAYSGATSAELAVELGIQGSSVTYCAGSATGSEVIGYGARCVMDDEFEMMLVGASDTPLQIGSFGGFCHAAGMSKRNDTPASAVRPFDETRDGLVLGEGAAFILLEELSHAKARNARIYAEFTGHGRACEAHHSVAPHPDGIGMKRAIERALRNAGLDHTEVDYINAHGTATDANDPVELRAIKSVFGDTCRAAISSTKAVTGHLLAAAGTTEAIVCILSLSRGVLPPTANLLAPIPEASGLDLITGNPRPYPARHALNMSVGFGGKNSALTFSKYTG